jgi:hypothetical protein
MQKNNAKTTHTHYTNTYTHTHTLGAALGELDCAVVVCSAAHCPLHCRLFWSCFLSTRSWKSLWRSWLALFSLGLPLLLPLLSSSSSPSLSSSLPSSSSSVVVSFSALSSSFHFLWFVLEVDSADLSENASSSLCSWHCLRNGCFCSCWAVVVVVVLSSSCCEFLFGCLCILLLLLLLPHVAFPLFSASAFFFLLPSFVASFCSSSLISSLMRLSPLMSASAERPRLPSVLFFWFDFLFYASFLLGLTPVQPCSSCLIMSFSLDLTPVPASGERARLWSTGDMGRVSHGHFGLRRVFQGL